MFAGFKQFSKHGLKRFYHTKPGRFCWKKFTHAVNRPFIRNVFQKALNSPPGQDGIQIDFTAQRYGKNALVVFPFWEECATKYYIVSLCRSLRELGYAIHAVVYNQGNKGEVFSPYWDHVYPIHDYYEHYENWNIHQDIPGVDRNRIDDWVGETLMLAVEGLDKLFNFQLCVCNYVFLSKVFEALSPDTFKLLCTHDIFLKRNTGMSNAGVTERGYYFSVASAEEEAAGLGRADMVLAIQDEEREYFASLVGKDRTDTLPYVPEKNYQPVREKPSPPVVGYIASRHAPNITALKSFCDNLPPGADIRLLLAGNICSNLDGIALPKNTEPLGIVADLAGFYAACDVLINPDILRSGLKIKCVEALSHGKPLVCTAAASAGIAVREPYHLLPDSASCARYIGRIADNPRLLPDMAAESRRVYDAFAGKYSPYDAFRSYDLAARAKRLAGSPVKRRPGGGGKAPKVSVIIPAYNAERYFEQCLLSAVDQTLRDIEIIPVDDGSPDACGAIMDAYAAEDPRVMPVHQPNGGYGKAVNAGLRAATGEYVALIEADDWAEPDMLEALYSVAKEHDRSVVKGTFYKHESGRGPYVCGFGRMPGGTKEYACPADDPHLVLHESSIWSAIYRRDFLLEHGISMLETPGAAYQDVAWKFSVYSLLDTVLFIDKPVYHYRVMAQGSSSANPGKAGAMFVNYEALRGFLEKHGTFARFKEKYYAHQFLDFVFHAGRLRGEALEIFRHKAYAVIAEAEKEHVTLGTLLRLRPDVKDYIQPVWDWVLGKNAYPAR